jgi:hypothetical protein
VIFVNINFTIIMLAMDIIDNSSTIVKRSETKLFIQARLPVIEQEVTSVKSLREPEVTSSMKPIRDQEVTSSFIPTTGNEINKFGWNGSIQNSQKLDHGKGGRVPSDIRCVVVHSRARGTVDNDALPNITGDVDTNERLSSDFNISQPLVISCRGASRRSLSVDRASTVKQEPNKPSFVPKPPVYRLSRKTDDHRKTTARVSTASRALPGILIKSARFRGAPIKQSYFILQRPGVTVKSATSTRCRHSGPIVTNHAHTQEKTVSDELDKISPELELFSISFRDSDSLTFDSASIQTHSDLSCKDISLGINRTHRMRNAIIPYNVEVCLTGTSKTLHSRSDFRFT